VLFMTFSFLFTRARARWFTGSLVHGSTRIKDGLAPVGEAGARS